MRYLLIALLLFFGCANYKVIDDFDEFEKNRTIKQVNNHIICVPDNWCFELNLRKHFSDDIKYVLLTFEFVDHDWLFIEKTNSLQFLFDDNEVLKLSSLIDIEREVLGDARIREIGAIILDKESLLKLINKKIKSIRLNGEKNKDFNSNANLIFRKNIPKVQGRWNDFAELYLQDFLSE